MLSFQYTFLLCLLSLSLLELVGGSPVFEGTSFNDAFHNSTLLNGAPLDDTPFLDTPPNGTSLDYTEFKKHFEAAYQGDGIPLRRMHQRYLHKRDLHHELFQPQKNIQLDVLHGRRPDPNVSESITDCSQAKMDRPAASSMPMRHTSI